MTSWEIYGDWKIKWQGIETEYYHQGCCLQGNAIVFPTHLDNFNQKGGVLGSHGRSCCKLKVLAKLLEVWGTL